MPHLIRAACCRHIIRYSMIPLQDAQDKDTDIDFNTPNCVMCEDMMRRELNRTQRIYDHSCELEMTSEAGKQRHKKAVREYDTARKTVANAKLYKEDVAESRSSPTIEARVTSTRVRFDEEQEHRSESLVRGQAKFDRMSSLYLPGRYADQTGDGFLDTSLANSIAKWESKWDR